MSMKLMRKTSITFLCVLAILLTFCSVVYAAPADSSIINLNMPDGSSWSENITIMVFITVLSMSPAIILCMTCFTRFIVVLGFTRQALGVQQLPPTQVLIGLAFFMTIFVMNKPLTQIYEEAYVPYSEKKINSKEMFEKAVEIDKKFMVNVAKEDDLLYMAELAKLEEIPDSREELPLHVIIPGFLLGELKAGFQMGLIILISFAVVDIVVASVLMSMGMMMLSPVMISLPFKIMLFLMANGWTGFIETLVKSYPV